MMPAGFVHVPEDDHESRGIEWRVMESPYIRAVDHFPAAARDKGGMARMVLMGLESKP